MGQDKKKFTSLEDLAKSELGDAFKGRTNQNQPAGNQSQQGNRGVSPPDIYSGTRLLVPADTAGEMASASSVDNFSLRLNKFLSYNEGSGDDSLAKTNFGLISNPNFQAVSKTIKSLLDTQKTAANVLTEKDRLMVKELSTNWRLAIGLGTESVLETSMTLHHTYGFPYIPGQAFKAAIRSFVINIYFGNEDEALKSNDFCTLFGAGDKGVNNEQAGALIFFDVYPVGVPKVVKDIMNPHFGEYYQDGSNKVPGDYYDPIPVNFLTVIDTSYNFMVGVRKGKEIKFTESIFGDSAVMDQVADWIEKSLSIFGIGAKTAVGYGRFE